MTRQEHKEYKANPELYRHKEALQRIDGETIRYLRDLYRFFMGGGLNCYTCQRLEGLYGEASIERLKFEMEAQG